jgi:hypothetical protein
MSLAGAGAAALRKPATWRRPGGRGVARRRVAVAALLLALAYAGGLLMFLLDVGGAAAGGLGPAVTVASSVRRRPLPSPADAPPHAQPGSVYRSHLVFERLLPAMRDDATLASSLSASASWRRTMVSAACCSRFFVCCGQRFRVLTCLLSASSPKKLPVSSRGEFQHAFPASALQIHRMRGQCVLVSSGRVLVVSFSSR